MTTDVSNFIRGGQGGDEDFGTLVLDTTLTAGLNGANYWGYQQGGNGSMVNTNLDGHTIYRLSSQQLTPGFEVGVSTASLGRGFWSLVVIQGITDTGWFQRYTSDGAEYTANLSGLGSWWTIDVGTNYLMVNGHTYNVKFYK